VSGDSTSVPANIACIGCGGSVPAITGPAHRYMESSPGCWKLFGEVLAREYSDPLFAAAHRQTVDAFAVQHPGHPSPQSIQSVGVHLIRLCLIWEHGFGDVAAGKAMPVIARQKAEFHWLAPPLNMGAITAVDVWRAVGPKQHVARVQEWAASAWQAWSAHHDQIRRWLPAEFQRRL
jgi:hypothetical protein